jgi:hypothetical protein
MFWTDSYLVLQISDNEVYLLTNNHGITPDKQFHSLFTRLAEVGKLEPIKLKGNYDTGQMFLHRVFGYRGVILFPWTARVYDRDMPNKRDPR